MPFNKAKALQEAHKYVAQGKTPQAIRQYELIVEKDPSDLILLNVIGDLYAQENNIPEALKYFNKLADAYTREGYKVKAIAIYKKISKIDRSTADPLLRLAELQLAQGLVHEAREHYKDAFEFFERTRQKDKALDILRRLCQQEPGHAGLRRNLAQYAERAGEVQEAASTYLELSALAMKSGDVAASQNALSKAAELDPQNPEIHLARARQAFVDRRPEDVESVLASVPELKRNPQAQRMLLESYLATGRLEAAGALLPEVFQTDPSEFGPIAAFADRCIAKRDYDAALDSLRAVAPTLIARRDSAPLMESLHGLLKAFPERIDTLELMYEVAEKSADEGAIPEVLEAMGNAYVQTGELGKAEQAYARLVAREPENETYKDLLRKILEKQGREFVPLSQTPLISGDVGLDSGPDPSPGMDPEQAAIIKGAITNSDFFVRDGLVERAVEELEKVLRVYPGQLEIHKRILEVCREPLPARAVQAAEALAQIFTARSESSEAKRYHEEAQELVQAAARAEALLLTSPQEESQDLSAGGAEPPPASVEIDLTQPGDAQAVQEEYDELPPPKEISLEFRSPQEAGHPVPAAGVPPDNTSASQTLSAGEQGAPAAEDIPEFNYEECREEIEFYLRHGFNDEAQKAVAELERKYPGESRVAEFRERVGRMSQEAVPAGELHPDVEPEQDVSAGSEWELPTTFSGSAKAVGQEGPLEDLTVELASTLEHFNGAGMTSAASPERTVPGSAPSSREDASAELGSLLEELDNANESIDQAADDEQTHYNLGVAFREMGLLEEAIGEFQKVVSGTGSKQLGPYFLQGCTLLASCFMEKGMPSIAAKWYLRALDAPGLDHEGMLALYYDLGNAFEEAGDSTAALEKFTEVYSQNIDYRDVAEKIRHLRQASR